ncbi:unnamed protein product [Rotaria sordida]|uniref:VWFA domain-containing protein n=1 Tax=Rotaria sordida TaxID=392033 RepID=A0A813X3F2_9BILA|nr:unnamed protein product [Rotaria sordida]
MYPNIGSGTTQPSAPPPPSSTTTTTSTLSNSNSQQPVGFSSIMSQPPNQNTPYPGGQSSQPPYPTGPPSSSQPPYPTGPSSSSPSLNPFPSNNQPANTSKYSNYSLPATGQQPPPPQGGAGYQQGSYPPQTNPYPPSGYPPGQQPPRPTGYQNPYPPSNPYQSQQGNTGFQNPYQSSTSYPPQQGGYPPQQSNQNPYGQNPYGQNPYGQSPYGSNVPQQQSYQNPYGSNPQQQQSYQNPYGSNAPQQPYQNPYGSNPQQPQGGYAGGYNANTFGSPAINDRLRAITGRYEINDTLAQRLNILQQFEIVLLCDDSGSMNTPVDGTTGTRWDELRSIVQIVMEIGTVFDSNGVDVHFLNRPSMPNVTDSRQVIESFSQRPGGLTPLTQALRRIFQSAASKPGSDKRLLVFVATDGAPTDPNGNVDIQSLENLMRNERQANTTYVTFLACTDDESSVAYLSQWDRTMMNVDVVDDYKTEREEVRRIRGNNYPFSFGDYVAKALLGAVDPQMDLLDESGNNNNFRRF